MKGYIVLVSLFLSVSSLKANPVSIKDMADGYVRGGASWFHIADEYVAAKGGAVGEYDRSDYWAQLKLVAQGRAIYLQPDYYLVADFKTFPGKGEDGRSQGQLSFDKVTGKVFWSLTVERRDKDGKMNTAQGESEIFFVKGDWSKFEKGEDVELEASDAETQDNGKYCKSLLDLGWKLFRDQLEKDQPSVKFGPVETLREGGSTQRIRFKGNAQKLSLSYPRWTNEYKFTSHMEY